jgi:hypothetical protein
MNLAKLILLACPTFLASLLLVVHPVQAASIESQTAAQTVVVASAQSNSQFIAPTVTHANNPILEQLGCNCAVCSQSKFEMLQGKLPTSSL